MVDGEDKYKIITEKFEGPLDLLLHLVNKDQINIYDIPIASVTEQYLAYIFSRRAFDIELASEFLLMAATLLQIKSRLLLPKPAETPGIPEEETDPRAVLAEQLAVYRQFKFMGEKFAALWDKNALSYTRAPSFAGTAPLLTGNLSLNGLLRALAVLLEDSGRADAYIQPDEFNVQDKIKDIMYLLQMKGGSINLKETLIRSGSLGEFIAAFLAVLELLRVGRISMAQPETFGDIYLYGREGSHVL